VILDNEDIVTGDSVYDLLEGAGTVQRVFSDSFIVRFSIGRSYSYNSAGKRLGSTPNRFPRLLYWKNPIFTIPVKDDSKWESLQALVKNASNIIKRL